MKHLLTIFLVLFHFLVNAQQINEKLTAAFKANNAPQIAVYFDDKIDMSLPNQEGVYSKVQAEQILKKFLSTNRVKSFEFIHSGNSKNNIHYSIGEMNANGNDYRVYIKYQVINSKALIQEFKIEID